MTQIEKQVNDFRSALVQFDVENVDSLCSNFEDMLCYQKPPTFYWNFLDNGAFKECYDVCSDKIVIKFAVDSFDIIKSEANSLREAANYGVQHFFPKTIYVPLDITIPCGGYKDCNDNADFNYVIIQERIEQIDDKFDSTLKCITASNGQSIPTYIIFNHSIENLTWCELALQAYGVQCFYRLCRFIEKLGIEDISVENVGILPNKKPVIFDWMAE